MCGNSGKNNEKSNRRGIMVFSITIVGISAIFSLWVESKQMSWIDAGKE